MEDVNYDGDFNHDWLQEHQPLSVGLGYSLYHLYRDDAGNIQWCRDSQGHHTIYPRTLKDICIHRVITDTHLLYQVKCHDLPNALYPQLLAEAVFCNEIYAIVFLISTWPNTVLDVFDVIPVEESLYHTDWGSVLNAPIDGKGSMCLLDCFILGLLNLQPSSRLQVVDFSQFSRDRKLCREVMRLPILWLPVGQRTSENIHNKLLQTCDISKEKVERYLNRISLIYSNFAAEFKHGKQIDPITIIVNCDISLDDIPIGLGLQSLTPFRFIAYKVFMEDIHEVYLAPKQLKNVIDLEVLTHLEIKKNNPITCKGELYSLLKTLEFMPSLNTLGLPNVIDCVLVPTAVDKLSVTLRAIRTLRKLNMSHCNLKLQLKNLLQHLNQPLLMLNLRDCRLATEDLNYLLNWQQLTGLRELNLSHNNLRHVQNICLALVEQASCITCLSLSYCSLLVPSIIRIAKQCQKCDKLKVLSIQSFTPPPERDTHDILYQCALIPALQKCIILPDAYAFPGSNDEERRLNHAVMEMFCLQYFQQKSRTDIRLE